MERDAKEENGRKNRERDDREGGTEREGKSEDERET